MHWGDNVQRYSDGRGHSITIRHVGFANGRAVLRWVYRRFRAPRRVFVTGCSAGCVGSAVFAPYVIRHYRRATVEQLGNSLAFVFARPVNLRSGYRIDRNLPRWIPGIRRHFNPARMTMAQHYTIIGRFYRRHRFAQFDYARDRVQTRYYVALGGKARDFQAALARNLATIRRGTRSFRSYVAPGTSHCVLPLPAFYTEKVQGVSLKRWVTRLAAGENVASVRRRR